MHYVHINMLLIYQDGMSPTLREETRLPGRKVLPLEPLSNFGNY